ncbi:hypothetical protein NFI96_009718 [Prochilodus magdalenae]|nr:hypothetical protein NFI96_009718 [Prochilodus magdalenae]
MQGHIADFPATYCGKNEVHADQQPKWSMPVPSQQPARASNDSLAQEHERPALGVGVNRHCTTLSPDFLINRKTFQVPTDDRIGTGDITRYLMRRELVHSGLTKFNDHPESYWAWKSSFKNATDGLYLTASEELDLLIKWLGSPSSNHVMRIRAVYSTNPTVGLHKAWERLEECYGSPEVIERALLERVDNFPNVSQKDPVKLRELGDLLKELEAAKTQGYLPGLSYLDTAGGANQLSKSCHSGYKKNG